MKILIELVFFFCLSYGVERVKCNLILSTGIFIVLLPVVFVGWKQLLGFWAYRQLFCIRLIVRVCYPDSCRLLNCACVFPDFIDILSCAGNINGGMVEHRNGGWDDGRGYGGRGRGHGRGRGFRGRGRGYGGGNMQRDSGYFNGNGPSGPSPAQGRGKPFAFNVLSYPVLVHSPFLANHLLHQVVDEAEEGDGDVVVVRVSDLMVHSRKVLETTRALIRRFFCRTLALVNKKSCPF